MKARSFGILIGTVIGLLAAWAALALAPHIRKPVLTLLPWALTASKRTPFRNPRCNNKHSRRTPWCRTGLRS